MKIKISKSQWEEMGRKAGWVKKAGMDDGLDSAAPAPSAEGGFGISPSALTNDQMIHMSGRILENIAKLEERMASETINAKLMAPLWAATMAINMMAHSKEVDPAWVPQLNNAVGILSPYCMRMKRNFMSTTSAKSKREIGTALQSVKKLIETFRS